MRKRVIMLVAVLAILPSCSYFKKKGEPVPPVIRYINLKAVYNFVLNKNRDALDVKKKLDAKITRLKEIESGLDDPATDHVALLDEYRAVSTEIAELRGRSRYYKGKILAQIDRALKNLAQSMHVDFICNIGDDLLYAKKEFDITEDVLREIMRLNERRAPESR
ncbi:MAG: OmpH family outer membrane protein [Spirochaetes bacterium]|nr:OmpH family outer membrane protein [Spirochaetota bacterium]